MLIASLGVVAALAFVLGLGALCLWALKRWGKMSLKSRTRVAVEVVQRIPMGPKTGLAVVRVGEKVMAVSVGEGGIRTLFELDEADRRRVIESSQVPTPMASSVEATASFAKFVPSVFGRTLQQQVAKHVSKQSDESFTPAAVVAPTVAPMTAPMTASMTAPYAAVVAAPTFVAPEIPSFLTAAPTMRSGQPLSYGPPRVNPADRDFRAMLGGAISGATRLAVFAGAMVLAAATAMPLRAQAAPPTTPPTTPPVSTQSATQGATQGAAQGATQVTTPAPRPVAPAAAATAPQTLPLPEINVPAANNAAANVPSTAASTSQPIVKPLVQPIVQQGAIVPPAMPGARRANAVPPKTGNGAGTTSGGTVARRPMSQMQVDSAANASKNPKAGAAQPAAVGADEAIMRMMPQMDIKMGDEKDGGLRLNGTVGIVVMMGLLTLLPTLLLMMTGFTRILIVLHFLKQAMGTQSAPPAQLLGAMALLLTGFVMAPTLSEVNSKAITPWLDGKITQVEMMKTGVQPMREFMLKQTRESDLKTFIEMSRLPRPNTVDDVPLHVLMSAFVASELRTAFQIGFAIYLPFIIIDAVVASVLMSMGMFMLPPAMISLPFKLLLFVLVDGWSLTISSLVQSFK